MDEIRTSPSSYFSSGSRAPRASTSHLISPRLSDELMRRLAEVGQRRRPGDERHHPLGARAWVSGRRGIPRKNEGDSHERHGPPVHIYFVLDRSGSMQSIAPDVIGGFNAFLAAQQADGSDALLTLVQFDSQNLTRYSSTRPPSRVPHP